MQELDLALEMLHAVLDEKTAFAEALRLRFLAWYIATIAVQFDKYNTVRIPGKCAVFLYCIHNIPPNFS